jgi:hypothetical protein
MTKPFTLADGAVSHDTLQALRELTASAERGGVTGMAYIVTERGKTYQVNATGLIYDSPTFGIGTVVILLYRLVMRAIGRDT